MQVKLKLWPFLVLAAILLQCAYPSLSLPKGNSSELNSTESNYLKWVKHMGFVGSYKKHSHSQLRKSGKKKKYRKWKKNPCKRTIKVNKNDLREGDFVSIQEAINSLPLINTCRVVISVSSGTYKEKVVIPPTMGYVTVKGQGAENTVIEWDDTADKLSKSGKPMGTFGSATFAVTSTNFIAKNITFKNTAPAPHSGTLGKQAVAMRVSGDKAAFIGCHFIGAQDTLYDHKGRHYFKECYIQGSIDFIFGNGLSIYEDCHLHAAANNSYGALTAQKRGSMLEETGFSFVNCKITGSGVLYLGRAWGTFSRVVFAYTYMDKIIIPTGWYDWGDKNRDMTVFYGQYKCSGPGAEYGARVAWSRELTTNEVAPFVSVDFIDGYEWLRKSWSKLA